MIIAQRARANSRVRRAASRDRSTRVRQTNATLFAGSLLQLRAALAVTRTPAKDQRRDARREGHEVSKRFRDTHFQAGRIFYHEARASDPLEGALIDSVRTLDRSNNVRIVAAAAALRTAQLEAWKVESKRRKRRRGRNFGQISPAIAAWHLLRVRQREDARRNGLCRRSATASRQVARVFVCFFFLLARRWNSVR
jgi:hypothetical protein